VSGKIQQLEEGVVQLRALLFSWRYKNGCWCRIGKWEMVCSGHDERCLQIQAALAATEHLVGKEH